AADLNNDGIADVVVANHASNDLTIAKGLGAATFAAPSTIAIDGSLGAPSARDLAVLDLDADGKRDVLVLGQGPDRVFSMQVDADGKLDIVSCSYGSAAVCVQRGTGAATFLPFTSFPAGPNPRGMTVADLNGDSKLDCVTANYGGTTASVLIGNGLGAFAAPV